MFIHLWLTKVDKLYIEVGYRTEFVIPAMLGSSPVLVFKSRRYGMHQVGRYANAILGRGHNSCRLPGKPMYIFRPSYRNRAMI